jgi:hypothetical protein
LAYSYDNGYIFLPVFYAGTKMTPEILCAYPVDAATNNRSSKGCGEHIGVAGSGPCQAQGIFNATAWLAHYRSGNSSHTHQCGFSVSDDLNTGASAAFNAVIQSMALMGMESFNEQNELKIATWPDGSGMQLPLEAFFYLKGSAGGLSDAKNDQKDFKNVTGISLPVISVQLPAVPADAVTFRYLPADQTIALP